MRILLVNPPPYKIIEPLYDTPIYPRTSIAYLAGYLRKKNVDVHVLDCKFDRIGFEGGLDFIKKIQPDVVGFTAFTNEIKQASRFAKFVKTYDPKIITIVGSVHVSALPERTLREFPEFDFGVVGEGEETLHELITCLGNGSDLSKIPGVCFLDSEGCFVYGGERLKIADQDSLPFPAWDMFRPAEEYLLHSSRGCPYACGFCMNPGGRQVRARSTENVLNEIQWLVDTMRPKSIWFGDEIFTIQRERTMAISRGIIDRGFHKILHWKCQTHVRTIDLEMLQLMKASNCSMVGLGIESGDDEKLKAMGKGITFKNISEAVNMVKQAKLPFICFFILGQPNETYKSAKNTIDFAVKLNPTLPILGIMVPYPGTEVATMAERGEGGYVLLSSDWNEYNKQFGNALAFKDLSRKQLERLQFFGYLKVFIWNFRFIDLLKFLWTFKKEGFAVVKKQIGLMVKDSTFSNHGRDKTGDLVSSVDSVDNVLGSENKKSLAINKERRVSP